MPSDPLTTFAVPFPEPLHDPHVLLHVVKAENAVPASWPVSKMVEGSEYSAPSVNAAAWIGLAVPIAAATVKRALSTKLSESKGRDYAADLLVLHTCPKDPVVWAHSLDMAEYGRQIVSSLQGTNRARRFNEIWSAVHGAIREFDVGRHLAA